MFNNFYNESFRRCLVAFASMFDNINITLDNGKDIRVPLHYAQKEKFVEVLEAQNDPTSRIKNISYPVMGYEMIAMNFAPERNTNALNQIKACDSSGSKFMYNRVPYDIMFELYIATKRLDDGFKIVEQIIPVFSPSLVVKVKEHPDMNIDSNMIFDLTSVSYEVNYNDDFSDVRDIMWQLSFTLKTYMYRHTQDRQRIEQVVVNAVNGYNTDNNVLARYTTLMNNGNLVQTVEENPHD